MCSIPNQVIGIYVNRILWNLAKKEAHDIEEHHYFLLFTDDHNLKY